MGKYKCRFVYDLYLHDLSSLKVRFQLPIDRKENLMCKMECCIST